MSNNSEINLKADATATADSIRAQANASKEFSTLVSDAQQEQSKLGNSQLDKQYFSDLASDLQKQGVLPNLIVEGSYDSANGSKTERTDAQEVLQALEGECRR